MSFSPKIQALHLQLIERWNLMKRLIFCEWVSFLTLIGDALGAEGYKYARLTGQ
jgi:SNF2 family DNA or RNA helicase